MAGVTRRIAALDIYIEHRLPNMAGVTRRIGALDIYIEHRLPNMAGVTRRIGALGGLSNSRGAGWIPSEPGTWQNHGRMHEPHADDERGGATYHGNIWAGMQRLQQRAFLWTAVRLPASRCLSSLYYHCARHLDVCPPTQQQKIRKLGSADCSNDVYDYLRPPGAEVRRGVAPVVTDD